ncbi:hypothetical protein RCCS2_08984 [Roseobacter sp. CCS2]|nr:hypothetical protein RCCS2_08984 [Roseobacter sp. CCS2]
MTLIFKHGEIAITSSLKIALPGGLGRSKPLDLATI